MKQAEKTPDKIQYGRGAVVLLDSVAREYVFYVNAKRRCVHGILYENKNNLLFEKEFHHTEWCSMEDTFDPEVGIWGAKFRLDILSQNVRWRDSKPIKYQSFKRYMDKFRVNEEYHPTSVGMQCQQVSVTLHSTPEHMTITFPGEMKLEEIKVEEKKEEPAC